MLKIEISNKSGKARTGKLITAHGEVETPVFMPVGTAGTVKGLTPQQLYDTGSRMILGNTYHLMLRPTAAKVAALGGLHKMMGWSGPILTDSGGYQVFSLAHLRKLTEDAVFFQSHIDGSKVELSPELAVDIQHQLGSDVLMQLDECTPADAEKKDVAAAVDRSAKWAARCKTRWQERDCLSYQGHCQALFGIQQGGVFRDLRAESAQRLAELDLPGYAIGGLSVGEGHEAMCEVLEDTDALFPKDKPRYLMGVGEPRDLVAAVLRGVDMFDCVMPTRNGRNAQAFTWNGRLRLRNAQYSEDTAPLDENCTCYTCRTFSKGTIRHLFMAREMLGPILVTLHNLHFFADFMRAIRQAIAAGTLEAESAEWLRKIYS